MDADFQPAERRNFYGRIRGKTLRASQKTYLAEDLGPQTLHGVPVFTAISARVAIRVTAKAYGYTANNAISILRCGGTTALA